jgi:hypothetical protein
MVHFRTSRLWSRGWTRFRAGRFMHLRPRRHVLLWPGCRRPLGFRSGHMRRGFVRNSAWLRAHGGSGFGVRCGLRPGFGPGNCARVAGLWTRVLRTHSLRPADLRAQGRGSGTGDSRRRVRARFAGMA